MEEFSSSTASFSTRCLAGRRHCPLAKHEPFSERIQQTGSEEENTSAAFYFWRKRPVMVMGGRLSCTENRPLSSTLCLPYKGHVEVRRVGAPFSSQEVTRGLIWCEVKIYRLVILAGPCYSVVSSMVFYRGGNALRNYYDHLFTA